MAIPVAKKTGILLALGFDLPDATAWQVGAQVNGFFVSILQRQHWPGRALGSVKG
jgi:hypothetical protein